MVKLVLNRSGESKLGWLRWVSHPWRSYREHRARRFWSDPPHDIADEIKSRLRYYSPESTCRWIRARLRVVPEGVSSDLIWMARYCETRSSLRSADGKMDRAAVIWLADNQSNLKDKNYLKELAEIAEDTAVANSHVDYDILELVPLLGPASPRTTELLAAKWSEQDRTDELACKIYTHYAANLGEIDEKCWEDLKPLKLLRSLAAAEGIDDPAALNRALTINNRMRLLNPTLGWPLIELGIAWLKKGQSQKAACYLDEASRITELPAGLNLTLGHIYLENGAPNLAGPCFERAREGGVDEKEIILRFALVAVGKNDIASAEEYVAQILLSDTRNISARNLMGNILLKRGLWQEAENLFGKVVRDDECNGNAWWGLARCAELGGRLDDAERILKKLSEEKLDNAPTELALGSIAEARKDYSRAQDHYRKATELKNNYYPAYARLGFVLLEHGCRYDEALDHLKKAYEGMTGNDVLLDGLARCEFLLGNFNNALGYWRQIGKPSKKVLGSRARAAHNLAVERLAARDFDGALEMWNGLANKYKKRVEVKSGMSAALQGKSIGLLKRGWRRKARACLDEALQIDPGNGKVVFLSGLLDLMAGKTSAEEALAEASGTCPEAAVLHALLCDNGAPSNREAVTEAVGKITHRKEIYSALANIIQWDIETLFNKLVSDKIVFERLPLMKRQWQYPLALTFYSDGKYEKALEVAAGLDDEKSDQIKLACHLKSASVEVAARNMQKAIDHLDIAEKFCEFRSNEPEEN